MTFSSYPYIKLLVAIVTAIVVGRITGSLGWGLGTFFIAMFIFIWVSSWIFGSSIQGKVEVNEELDFLLDKLRLIGNKKNELPFAARGWCNSLGLFVQLKEKGNMTRLQAGDKYLSKIDAWLDIPLGADNTFSLPDSDSIFSSSLWKVKKYEPGDWEKLVDPTIDIAYWLCIHGGLPDGYMDSFIKAIETFKKEGYLELPSHVNMDAIDSGSVIEETQYLSNGGYKDKDRVAKAEVLEEMFKMPETLSVGISPSRKGFHDAETNVIIQKVNPLIIRAFPVEDKASNDKIDELLKHPLINCPLPDQFIMSAASRTPMPVEMAERILRRLLEDQYDTCYGLAEERVRSGRQI